MAFTFSRWIKHFQRKECNIVLLSGVLFSRDKKFSAKEFFMIEVSLLF